MTGWFRDGDGASHYDPGSQEQEQQGGTVMNADSRWAVTAIRASDYRDSEVHIEITPRFTGESPLSASTLPPRLCLDLMAWLESGVKDRVQKSRDSKGEAK